MIWLMPGKAFFEPRFQTNKKGPIIDPRIPANIRDIVSGLAKRPACADILARIADKLGTFNKILPTEPGKTFIETVFDSMKKIIIDPKNAGSGAQTAGRKIWLNDVNNPR